MTSAGIIIWILAIAAAYMVIYAIQIPLRKTGKIRFQIISMLIKIPAAVYAAYQCIAVPYILPIPVVYLLVTIYFVFLADAATDIVILVIRLLKKKEPRFLHLATGLVLVLAFTIYAIINMQVTTGKTHVYTSDKITHEHRIVFAADIHYGSAKTKGAVISGLEKIREEEPDLILLGGDITDELTTKEEMEEIFKMLGGLGAPVYFIYGNHDLQLSASDVGGRTYSDDELINAIESNGIIILQDEYVTIDDDLVILGRDDFSSDKRKSVEDLPEIPSGRYFITVDHAPYQYDDIVKTGADLQLSGHVHAAQLFPLSILYTLKVDNIYGSYRMGRTDIYVSSGFSGWAFPFRTEAHCNYEVIILKPDGK